MTIEGSSISGIEERLDLIAHLLVAQLTRDMTRKAAVQVLADAALTPKEIAKLLGLTGNQVSVVLYETRQAAAKQAKTPKNASTRA